MKTHPPTSSTLQHSLRPIYGRLAAAAVLLCVTSTVTAQSVLGSGTKTTLTPRIIQKDTTPDSTSDNIIAGPETGSSIQLGDIKLLPQLQLRYMQTNGIPLGAGTATSTDSSVFTFAPGLGLELGSNWTVSYNPTWTNYSNKTLTDTTSQSVSVIGAAKANEWTFQFSEAFQSSQDILVETARQTKQHTWATVVSAMRKIGQRSQYSGTFNLNEQYGDIFDDSKTWSTDQWFRSQITPKLNAGLGVTLSKTDFSQRADVRSEGLLGSIQWKATEKVDFTAQGGVERRRIETAGSSSLRSPTLQISLNYRPFEQTRLTVAYNSATANALYSELNQVTRNSGWSIALNQRLLEKLNLSMTYNDSSSDYKSTATTAQPTVRADKYKSFNTTLGVKILKYWTVSAIYQTAKNTSDQGFGFSTTQYGVELSGAF